MERSQRQASSRALCKIARPVLLHSVNHLPAPRTLFLASLLYMEYRQLGHSGLKVSALSFGAGTFGGGNDSFKAWGDTDVEGAKRLVNICLDADVNLFDTADIYSNGLSEEILGKAIDGKRNRVLISTKATFPMGTGPNDAGSSRYHLIRSCEDSLRRLNIDHID